MQDQLRVTRDPGREIGRQGDGLVQRVGVQRLGAAQNRAHRLIGGADDVVIGVLLLQGDPRGLAMGAQHLGAFLFGPEFRHYAMPERPRGTQLGDLHEEIHPDGKEERQTPGELVDIHSGLDGSADVLPPVGQCIGQLLHEVRARFLHVIAGNGDRVELRHLVRGILDNVGDDPHRGLGRIDIGVPHHEFLEDIVLNGAGQNRFIVALLLAGHDETGQHRDHGAVHRHRHRNLVERDAVKEDLHVLDAVDGDPRLADIPNDARMVTVIAPVRREIKGD